MTPKGQVDVKKLSEAKKKYETIEYWDDDLLKY